MKNRERLVASAFVFLQLLSFCPIGNVLLLVYAQDTDLSASLKKMERRQYKIIQGDILAPLSGPNAGYDSHLWTDGIVPYAFHPNVSAINQSRTLDAMAEWEAVAEVDFVPFGGHQNFIFIHSDTVNNSWVGMLGGAQQVNIVSWGKKFKIAHELGHALGLWHEQQRPDRDNYVAVDFRYIQQGAEHNFEIARTWDVYPKEAYGLPDTMTYDFDSVMHYDSCAFSIDCPPGSSCDCTNRTIHVLPHIPDWLNWQTRRLGQRTHLSFLDQLTMSFLYPKTNWRFLDQTNSGGQDGSFLFPFIRFIDGIASTPFDGTLIIQPGAYPGVGTYVKAVTLEAPLGQVTIGR